jgi:hypothetical protein
MDLPFIYKYQPLLLDDFEYEDELLLLIQNYCALLQSVMHYNKYCSVIMNYLELLYYELL